MTILRKSSSDGNIFGGGRGFAGDAYTAGNVAGEVTMNIKNGTILGSVYGGGRLGSVGYGLYDEGADGYGEMRDDKKMDDGSDGTSFFTKGRGHVEIKITGGTIGNTNEFIVPQESNIPTGLNADFKQWNAENWTTWKNHNNVPNTEYDISNGRVLHTKGGNVYAGGMGRYTQLDGSTPISTYENGVLSPANSIEWSKLGNVKSTTLNISGTPWIMGNVYGGGEMGAVRPYTSGETVQGGTTTISITGGTIGTEVTGATPVKETVSVPNNGNSSVKYTFGSVYGGGMGMNGHDANDNHGGEVKVNTTVNMSGTSAKVRASVYGGGEMAIVNGNTNVTISGGEIGRNEVQPQNGANPGYVMFGGATMGNVFGGGKGTVEHVHAGQVMGNTFVTINAGEDGQPFIYHNVYGGGSLASVGTFRRAHMDLTGERDTDPSYIPSGVPYDWTANTGTATVTINGGTIGISGRDNGMVNGSSRGDISMPTGSPAIDPYDKVAWVNNTIVNIGTEGASTGPQIKGSVYGGGENGHNGGNATVNVMSGTIGIIDTDDDWVYFADETISKKARVTRGNVYGAGCGTDMYDSDNDGTDDTHNPKAGIVAGNTFVNISGGIIANNVYGAGSMGPVGTVINSTKHDDIRTVDEKEVIYGFGLSWPYEFEFLDGTGKATVNVTGGHIGAQVEKKVGNDTVEINGDGDVYGSARGEAGDRYATANLAFVKETEVNVGYEDTADASELKDLSTLCITGSVHGSGEDGYVYGDTHVTLNNGLIGHSLYGGGKGAGKYSITLKKIKNEGEDYTADIYSLISGKVFGDTYVTMNGGQVIRSVYGGGNIASVGKGNYTGGSDDYSTAGYGELPSANDAIWTANPTEGTYAWHFQNSGRTHVLVAGGTVGMVTTKTKEGLPYGNVLGGSRGVPAPNVDNSPRYHYCPEFFSGYVNETDVNIGGYKCTAECMIGGTSYKVGSSITAEQFKTLTATDKEKWEVSGPTIYGSVYGGGQDGHVRRDAHVTVFYGDIGLPFTEDNRTSLGTFGTGLENELNHEQWLLRGNVFGSGSGISQYEYDYHDDSEPEVGYSTSAGSVTRFTTVDILGGTIHHNVYGGGSQASVGAPKIPPITEDLLKRNDNALTTQGKQSQCTVNIGGGTGTVTIGTPDEYQQHYGGEVYGASRGNADLDPTRFGFVIWTQVNIKDGAHILGNVFGGGDAGMVKKDTEVNIGEAAPTTTTNPTTPSTPESSEGSNP